MAWLKKGLAESPCHFKVILNSVPIIAFPELWSSLAPDRWEGYGKQRDELLDHIIDSDIRNVWFLSGDLHCGVVGRVERTGPRRRIWEILMGPGAPKVGNPLPKLHELVPDQLDASFPPDQFVFGDSVEAATVLTFDPIKDAVHVVFVRASDQAVIYDAWIGEND